MTPSKYQAAFYQAVAESTENLAVDAVAGSGKSTSIEHGVGHLPRTARTGIFAFNRAIVTAMETRMQGTSVQVPDDLYINTISAFGWEICREHNSCRRVTKEKDEYIFKDLLDMGDRSQSKEFYALRNLINRLMILFKANLVIDDGISGAMIQSYLDEYGLDYELTPRIEQLVNLVWAKSMRDLKMMNFADQIYQPIRKGWPIPKHDVRLVDELQDLNAAQQELMLRGCGRFIGVGDSRQAIYAFAGADAKSLENMVERTNATRLPLSISYRCPKAVVRQAQEIVPHMEYADFAPEGIVDRCKIEKLVQIAVPGDFVLCRQNAPLVKECLAMIRAGKTAQVKGKEIGEGLIVMVERTKLHDSEPSNRLFDAIDKYQREETERLARANREQMIEALEDRCETVKVLLEAEADVGGVKRRINSIFSDYVKGVTFMSMHKAKGLETTRNFILRDDLLPPKAKRKRQTQTQLVQEWNLKYVAITRTMFKQGVTDGELYYVD